MCPTLPNKILQNLSRKIPSKKNVPLHRRYNALQRGSNCHFCQKNAFFGQKMTFFQNDCFIEKWSVTQNTTFKCIKNIFLLSNQELVFFTEFNLSMTKCKCNWDILHHRFCIYVEFLWKFLWFFALATLNCC